MKLCVPMVKGVKVSAAVELPFSAMLSRTVAPSLKVTVPVRGVEDAPEEATVAVSVSECAEESCVVDACSVVLVVAGLTSNVKDGGIAHRLMLDRLTQKSQFVHRRGEKCAIERGLIVVGGVAEGLA